MIPALTPGRRYVLGRIAQAVLVLWAAYTVIFGILHLLPGDPVGLLLGAGNVSPDEVSPAQLASLKAHYGLDRPLYEQYFSQLWNALHLDFGASISLNLPVREVLAQKVPSTLALGATAITLALVLGTGLAYLSAFVQWRPAKVLLSRLPSIGVSLPQFFVGLLLIQVFAFSLGWFPATGTDGWKTLILPAVTMSIINASMLAQVLTRSLEDTLDEPFITTARAKGLSRTVIQLRHAFRNAALPALTLLGVLLGTTLTEAIVAETVFSRDGVGRLVQQAVLNQDVPLVQAIVLLAAAVFVLINLVVDLVYPLLDPRIVHAARVS